MDSTSLIQFLWLAGMALQAVLGVVLLSKRSWRSFPFFSLYCANSFLSTVWIYLVRTNPRAYFYSYWIFEAVGIVLAFAVFYEVFSHLFRIHDALRRIATGVFQVVLVVLLGIGIAVLLKHSPLVFTSIAAAVDRVEQSARIIEVGAVICLFALCSAFGLHWRQQVFGVALGLGLFTSVELITVTARALAGTAVYSQLNLVRMVAYTCSLLIWLGYFLAPEHAANEAELPQRSQLEQWNQAVMELIRQ